MHQLRVIDIGVQPDSHSQGFVRPFLSPQRIHQRLNGEAGVQGVNATHISGIDRIPRDG
ncbi:hypothetical protein D3C86_1987120 [compost metagenome]